MTITVKWIDRMREPQDPPNPESPDGIDIDASSGAANACKVNVPYPAKRCGLYLLVCETCGRSAVVTTAGRRDDPRSVKMDCNVLPVRQ